MHVLLYFNLVVWQLAHEYMIQPVCANAAVLQEFLAATINKTRLEREERLREAFQHFDLDGDGQITRDELVQTLEKVGDTALIILHVSSCVASC